MLNRCPFGLPINVGCKCAGGLAGNTEVSAISLMNPLDLSDDEETTLNENIDILNEVSNPERCPFADKIFKNKVDCKFSYNTNFVSNQIPINGSPEYPSLMVGNNSVPGFGHPTHEYSDNNNAQIYYGLISLVN
jgi:hypothetical protein